MTEEGASEKLSKLSEPLICLRSSLPKTLDCGGAQKIFACKGRGGSKNSERSWYEMTELISCGNIE